MTDPPRAAGVVLAAGLSSRLAGPATKLLLPYGRTTVLSAVIESAKRAGLAPVIVVVGHRAAEVRAGTAADGAVFVACPDYRRGRRASLCAGLAVARSSGAPAIAVLLGDEPGIDPGTIRETVRAFAAARASEEPPPAARALYEDRPGHPVVLGPEAADELLAAGPGGGRDPRFLEVRISGPAPIDIDTAEDHGRALARLDP